MFDRPEGIEKCRIWIDGCFDFAHHGHAGAMLQAKQLGRELYVGVHSDEEILYNKGPTVMKLDERMTAVEACKWATKAISDAPYVTDPKFMDQYDCKYVVHGDDITTDANGEDCYQIMKDLGRFVIVKRTPNISTTDLVGRMLLMSKNHHYRSIEDNVHPLLNDENNEKFKRYATDFTGLKNGSGVYYYDQKSEQIKLIIDPSEEISNKTTIYYIDGGFDLFHPGHIEILKSIRKQQQQQQGNDIKIVVGLYDDLTINTIEGLNYPIMNILERSLCTLQCKYVDSIILGVPFKPTESFLSKLGNVIRVYVGPVTDKELQQNKYGLLTDQSLIHKITNHKYEHMNTEFIVNRVLSNKKAYEERQKRKGWKAEIEQKLKHEETEKGSTS
ncbi:putative phosphorylethanolamine transferase [Scheffersomyces coipomensis]|uniref:putative phosphorylethanolamine transferase n=1 Tax=Scheffersomyces coipomensis TaxID=1788519 RepID=UPI00315DDBA5